MNFISWAFVFLFIPVLISRLVFGRRKTERPFIVVTLVASTIFVMPAISIWRARSVFRPRF